jgi:putative ABC transport system permease protein
LWLALRELRAGFRRALLTGVAGVIGVGLISGTLVVLDTVRHAEAEVQQMGQAVLVAGCVALLVGAFVINAAFTVTLARRTRELALLRCLGADVLQLRRLVRLESLIIGVASSLAGLAFGLIAAALWWELVKAELATGPLSGRSLAVTPRTVLVSMVAGVVVLVLSALAPARRASRTSPLAALSDVNPTPRRYRSMPQIATGAATVVAGLSTVPLAVVTGTGYLLLAGAALTLVGVRLLGPLVAGPVVGVAGLLIVRPLRLPGELARRNAMRNPERTAATLSALLVGVALVSLVTVLSASTKAVIVTEANGVADFQVHPPRSLEPAAMDPEVVARLGTLQELSTVVPVQGMQASVEGTSTFVTAVDPAKFSRVWHLDVIAGSADLVSGEIGVTDDIAAAHGWGVGSRVEVELARGPQEFTIGAVYVDNSYVGFTPEIMMPISDYAQMGGDPAIHEVSMRVAEGVTTAAAANALVEAIAGHPSLVVESRAEVRDQVIGMINQATSVYLALSGLAALIGLFGIVNTVALSIVDRIGELGLLRAVGMEKRQVRSMVCAEAVVIAVAGAALGIGVGTFFGWGAAKVLEHSSAPTRLTVPVEALALVAVLAATAAVGAAMLPARWASRWDVLRALAAE